MRGRGAPDLAVRIAGRFNRDAREATEMLYEFHRPFVVDRSKFASAFGAMATPHDRAIAATVAAMTGAGDIP